MSFYVTNLTDPEVVPYTINDIKLLNFVEYLHQCEKYWQEQESNQSVSTINQTHKYTLPQVPKFMTFTQYSVLLNDYSKHRKRMLLLSKKNTFKLLNPELHETSVEFEQNWNKYQSINGISLFEHCPCCRFEDYSRPNKYIINEFVDSTQSYLKSVKVPLYTPRF